mgnify:CR=1 FL=1
MQVVLVQADDVEPRQLCLDGGVSSRVVRDHIGAPYAGILLDGVYESADRSKVEKDGVGVGHGKARLLVLDDAATRTSAQPEQGRDLLEGHAQLDGVCYAERVTIDTPAHIRATKKAIKKGIQNQIDRKGFSIIEVISPCPVQWGLAPCDAYRRIEREVEPFYGLKVFKDIDAEVQA